VGSKNQGYMCKWSCFERAGEAVSLRWGRDGLLGKRGLEGHLGGDFSERVGVR